MCRYLYDPVDVSSSFKTTLVACPVPDNRIDVYYSAAATFYAPSDPSGTGGMRREHIRATPSWFKSGQPRFDCAFVKHDRCGESSGGPHVVRILLFFGFKCDGIYHRCALVQWFEHTADQPDDETGMWVVRRARRNQGLPTASVIPISSIIRAAHLIGVYGTALVPRELKHYQSLDSFRTFYVNKFADHHAFELLH